MAEAPENIDQCELSARSSFGHQDQQPMGSSAEMPQAKY